MRKGTVKVNCSIGEGNRIFQYMYAKLLSHIHNANLSNPEVNSLGVKESTIDYNFNLPTIKINKDENDFLQYMRKQSKPTNYFVNTYPEDYTIYKPYLNLIKGWVESVPLKYNNDLVFHLRLGDRLMYKNEYVPSSITYVQDYINAINRFKYNKLYIVTDMKRWEKLSTKDLKNMKFHVPIAENMRVKWETARDYFNSLYDGLSQLKPVVRAGNEVKEDFDFIRSFRQILFKHGTLAWWAAALSHADRVGVYGPWRPSKGDKNKNLGKTDFEGWFQWTDNYGQKKERGVGYDEKT